MNKFVQLVIDDNFPSDPQEQIKIARAYMVNQYLQYVDRLPQKSGDDSSSSDEDNRFCIPLCLRCGRPSMYSHNVDLNQIFPYRQCYDGDCLIGLIKQIKDNLNIQL